VKRWLGLVVIFLAATIAVAVVSRRLARINYIRNVDHEEQAQKVSVGMTEAEVLEILGPDGAYSYSGSREGLSGRHQYLRECHHTLGWSFEQKHWDVSIWIGFDSENRVERVIVSSPNPQRLTR
jgi:hypothetical protein